MKIRIFIVILSSFFFLGCGSGDKKSKTVEGAPTVDESLSAGIAKNEEVANLLKGLYSSDYTVESNDCSNRSGVSGTVSNEEFEVSLSSGGILQVRLADLIFSDYRGSANGNSFTLVRQSTQNIPPTCALKMQTVVSGAKKEDGTLEGLRVVTDIFEGDCSGLKNCEKREPFIGKK